MTLKYEQHQYNNHNKYPSKTVKKTNRQSSSNTSFFDIKESNTFFISSSSIDDDDDDDNNDDNNTPKFRIFSSKKYKDSNKQKIHGDVYANYDKPVDISEDIELSKLLHHKQQYQESSSTVFTTSSSKTQKVRNKKRNKNSDDALKERPHQLSLNNSNNNNSMPSPARSTSTTTSLNITQSTNTCSINLPIINEDELQTSHNETTKSSFLPIFLKKKTLKHSSNISNLSTGFHSTSFPQIKKHLEECVKIHGPIHIKTSTLLLHVGDSYMKSCRYKEAHNIFNDALSIRRYLHSQNGRYALSIAIALDCIATSLVKIHNYKSSLKYFQEAFEIRYDYKQGNTRHLALMNTLNNIAGVYLLKHELSKAYISYKKVLNVRQEYYGHYHVCVAKTLENLGYVAMRLSIFHDALSFYKDALNIYTNHLHLNNEIVSRIYKDMERIERIQISLNDVSTQKNRENRRKNRHVCRYTFDEEVRDTILSEESDDCYNRISKVFVDAAKEIIEL